MGRVRPHLHVVLMLSKIRGGLVQHLAKINIPLYLRNKRGAKEERRKHRLWRASAAAEKDRAAIAREFGEASKVLGMVGGRSVAFTEKEARKGRVKFVAPTVFSITDGASETLAALSEFARQLQMPRVRSVDIDLHQVQVMDLAANALLDVIVEEVEVKAKRTKRKISWRGSYPANAEQRRLVRSLGVIKFLEVAHEYTPSEEAALVEAFHARAKHYVRTVRSNEADKKSRVTQRFADHLNKCLAHVGRVMKPESRKKLCDYVGEILDNAEEHAGMFDWTVQGYLDTHAEALICELAIFNFGRSIAESLATLAPGTYTRDAIQPYIAAHEKGGFFKAGWNRDDLFTLIALQGSVSSKNFSPLDTRGNGTVDLIDFFQKVCDECRSGPIGKGAARMTLLSGETSILFDGTYSMERPADRPGIIAFNSSNDLLDRPDHQFVRHLGGIRFPGTVLCIKFPLSSESSTTAIDEE